MMYKNMLAVAVKSNGKILREFEDKVYVPFGQEYSLFIKNLNSVRAQVKISIDDNDVLNGDSLVVYGNGSIDLERYLTDTNKGNRFKFIERTASVESHRGVGVADGLIRIEFQFEKKVLNHQYIPPYYPPYAPPNTWYGGGGGVVMGSGGYNGPLYRNASVVIGDTPNKSVLRALSVQPQNVGVTVPGSVSHQQFQTCSGFSLDPEKHVIVIQLLGEIDGGKVVAPVTVKRNVTCVTCGRKNKQTNKFCSNCGTSLEII